MTGYKLQLQHVTGQPRLWPQAQSWACTVHVPCTKPLPARAAQPVAPSG